MDDEIPFMPRLGVMGLHFCLEHEFHGPYDYTVTYLLSSLRHDCSAVGNKCDCNELVTNSLSVFIAA